MINWKLAVLLLVAVVAVSALDGVPKQHIRAARGGAILGPLPGDAKSFEFLGEDHDDHHRVARNEKEEVVGPSPDHEQVKPFEFLGEKNDHHHRVARNEKEEVVGPSPDHEQVKPFEFLGEKNDHHHRVARNEKEEVVGPSPDHEQVKPFEFLGEKNEPHVRVARNEKEEVVGPRPEPADVKPFEFLGTKSGHERVVRAPNKQEPETSSPTEHGEHTEGGSAHHRVARNSDHNADAPAANAPASEIQVHEDKP
ncbi:hypothetical protein M3Y99_00755900 [Aphelenchoides fujianensis]|nr:hypothetical protein M3Y99_00755900 [Aphelenchoides fujianensis]